MQQHELDFISDINHQIDAYALIERIGFHTEKLRRLGGTIKCCCPVHGDGDIATLLVDEKKKTVKCAKPGCDAARGLTLVDLFARHSGTSGVQAAVEAARAVGLPVPAETTVRLATGYLAAAREALAAEDQPAAIAMLEKARALAAAEPSLMAEIAAVAELAGDVASAAAHFRAAADSAKAAGDDMRAAEIVRDNLLSLHPGDEHLLVELADLLGKQGETEERAALLIEVADRREAEGREEENVALFKGAKALLKTRPELRLRYAAALAAQGAAELAVPEFCDAGEGFAKAKDAIHAIEAFRRASLLSPRSPPIRERLVAMRRLAGQDGEAERESLALADAYLASGSPADARRTYEALLGATPGLLRAQEGLAQVLASEGDLGRYAVEALRLAQGYDAAGEPDRARDLLEAACEKCPDNPDLLAASGDALVAAGKTAEAAAAFASAGALLLGSKSPDLAAGPFARATSLLPLAVGVVRQVADAYASAGFPERALSEWRAAVKRLMDAGEAKQAAAALESALALAPMDEGLLQMRLDALLSSESTEGLRETAERLHPLLVGRGDFQRAEANLERTLALLPRESALIEQLASLYLSQRRPAEALVMFRALVDAAALESADRQKEAARQVLALESGDASTRMILAHILHEEGDNKAAVADILRAADDFATAGDTAGDVKAMMRAVEWSGDDVAVLERAAKAQASAGHLQEAVELLERVLVIHRVMGRTEGIGDVYRSALQILPGHTSLRSEFGFWLADQGEAAAAIEQLLRVDAEYEEISDHLSASTALEKVLELDPDRTDSRERLASCYAELGDRGHAVAEYLSAAADYRRRDLRGDEIQVLERVVEIEPEAAEALERLAELHTARGEEAKAVTALVRLAGVKADRGEEEEVAALYERILALNSLHLGVRERLAKMLEKRRDKSGAVHQWEQLADTYRLNGEDDRALKVLSHVRELDPSRLEPLRAIVLIAQDRRDAEGARRGLLDLAEAAEAAGNVKVAEEAIADLALMDPDAPELAVRQASLRATGGNQKGAIEVLEEAALRYRTAGRNDSLRIVLQRAVELAPGMPELREALVDALAAARQMPPALAELLSLARHYAGNGANEMLERAISRHEVLGGVSWEVRLPLVELLVEIGARDRAVESIASLAMEGEALGDEDSTREALEYGLGLEPRDRRLRRSMASALERADDIPGAVLQLELLAESAAEAGELGEGIDALQKAKGLIEDDRDVRRRLALLHVRKGDVPAALEEFEAASELAWKAGARAEANALIRQALAIEPADADLRERLVQNLMATGETAEGLAELGTLARNAEDEKDWLNATLYRQRMSAAQPGAPAPLFELARVLLLAGKPHDSRAAGIAAIEACQTTGSPEQLEELLAALIDTDPECGEYRLRRARLLASMGRADAAAEEFFGMALAQHSAGDLAEAIRILAELVESNPGRDEFAERLAEWTLEGGEPDDALALFLRAAQGYRARGDLDGAARSLGGAVRCRPDSLETLNELAALEEDRGDRAAANAAWRRIIDLQSAPGARERNVLAYLKILTLEPEDDDARRKLCALYLELGRTADACGAGLELAGRLDAAKDLAGALEILHRLSDADPEATAPRERLAALHERTGRLAEARDAWTELAALARARRDSERALECLANAARAVPDDLGVGDETGEVLASMGRMADAATEFRRVAHLALSGPNPALATRFFRRLGDIDPGNIADREAHTELLERQGQVKEAREAYLGIAKLHLAAGRREEAVRAFSRAGRGAPLDVLLRRDIAKALAAADFEDDARAELLSAAQAQLENGTPAEAMELLKSARHVATEVPVAVFALEVRVRLAMSDVPGAVKALETIANLHEAAGSAELEEGAWREACELSPDHLPAREGLLRALARQGDAKKPQRVEAMRALMELHAGGGRVSQAIDACRRCIEEDASDLALRRRLADLYLEGKDWASALEVLLDVAHAHEIAGDAVAAIASYARVIELDAENIDALRALIALCERTNDKPALAAHSLVLADTYAGGGAFSDALAVLSSLLKLDDSDPVVFRRVGEYHEKLAEPAEAVEAFRRAAELFGARGDRKAAIEALRRVERATPDDPGLLAAIADHLLAGGDTAAATLALRRAADSLLTAGDFKGAEALADRLLAIDARGIETRRLRALLLEAKGSRTEAAGEHSQLAALALEVGDSPAAIQALAKAIELDSALESERRTLADLLAAAGDRAAAVPHYLELAHAEENRGAADVAIELTQLALDLEPRSLAARERMAHLYESLGDRAKAAVEFEAMAEIHRERGESGRRLELLATAVEHAPDAVRPRVKLAAALREAGRDEEASGHLLRAAADSMLQGNTVAAVEALSEAREIAPENAEVRRSLASVLLRLGRRDDALEEYKHVIRVHLSQGLVEEAHAQGEELLRGEFASPALRAEIAELYVENGIPELAAREHGAMAREAQQRGDAVAVREAAVRMLELGGSDIDARELLLWAHQKEGDSAAALETAAELADLCIEAGQPDRAADVLRIILVGKPEDVGARERLAAVLGQMGRQEEQVRELRLLTDAYLKLERHEDAVRVLRALLDVRPDDTRARIGLIDAFTRYGEERELREDYLKLAELHAKRGALVDAARTFEKAVQLDPQNPETRDRFVAFLIRQGQTSRALEESVALAGALLSSQRPREAVAVLQRAAPFAEKDAEFHYKLATAQSAANARGHALLGYRTAAGLFGERGDLDRKAEVLAAILGLDSQNIEARRELVELLRFLGRTQDAVIEALALADLYIGRGMVDLAEAEFRRILEIDPENILVWNRLFSTHLELGEEKDLLPDYFQYCQILIHTGAKREALQYYAKIIQIDPLNVQARRAYIDCARKTMRESDLVDEYLALADILAAHGQIDEAVELFSKVMALDPANTEARDRLSATQSRSGVRGATPPSGANVRPVPTSGSGVRPLGRASSEEVDVTATQARLMFPDRRTGSSDAVKFVAGQLTSLAAEDDKAALEAVVASYRDMLSVNPQNANIRIKLADILEQLSQKEAALAELSLASETLLLKGELNVCVSVCERILQQNPRDQKVRDRLSKAVLKRDAFKALESAILFSDSAQEGETAEMPRKKPKKK